LIIDIFFLHDRGKCFALYSSTLLLGTIAGGTFSGFIAQRAYWPVQFWYTAGLHGFTAILCCLFLDETGWTRPGQDIWPERPTSFLARKKATLLFTQRIMPHKTGSQMLQLVIMPFRIGASPVGALVGMFLFIFFAWSVATNTVISVYLQTPVLHGGYGFTPFQNAYCKLHSPKTDFCMDMKLTMLARFQSLSVLG